MSAKDEAIERLAKAAKEAVSDWGWKGGKPGELTGGEYVDTIKVIQGSTLKDFLDLEKKAAKQLAASGLLSNPYDFSEAQYLMEQFKYLEDAGFPRELTGKVLRAVNERGNYIPNPYRMNSNYWAEEDPNAIRAEDLAVIFKQLPKSRWSEPLQSIKSGVDYDKLITLYAGDGFLRTGSGQFNLLPDQISQVNRLLQTDRTSRTPRELALLVMKLDPRTRKLALEISAQDEADRIAALLDDGDPL